MLTTRYACISQTLSRRRHVTKWMYVCIFLVYCTQFPRKAACSWVAHYLESPAAGRPQRNGNFVLPENDYSEATSAPDAFTGANAGVVSSQQDRGITHVYRRLMALRQRFVSVLRKKRHPEWVVGAGLKELRSCFFVATPKRLPKTNEEIIWMTGESKYEDLIPDGYSVALMSAATGEINQYTFRLRESTWTLEDLSGEVYEFYLCTLKDHWASQSLDLDRIVGYVQDNLEVVEAFGVRSLQDVEDKFGVEVMQDILTHPIASPHLSFPDGVTLNFITLWKPAVSVHRIARAMEAHSSSTPEARDTVEMARLNLTYQVVQLVGRISLHGVLLPRFQTSNFHIRSSGYVSFRPGKVLRMKPHQSPASESTAAAPSEGKRTAWPSFDSFVNAKDLARVILFLWCPTEALEVSIYIDTPWTKDITAVLQRCLSMPEEVRGLVQFIVDGNANAAQVVRSDIPKRLHRRLLEMAKRVASA